jgi:hypothetical protein
MQDDFGNQIHNEPLYRPTSAGSSVRFLVFVLLELGKDSSPKEFRIRFRIALYIKQFRSLTPVGKWAKINFVVSSKTPVVGKVTVTPLQSYITSYFLE